MKKKYLFLLLFLSAASLSAQSPKREMRATWIATVGRIDWPRESGVAAQKNEMIKMLDSIRTLHLNTVFFQVRSRCDALYNSAYEPWSSDLTVNRGTDPGYDPLAFVIDECHKRGIECHAWLNPYRYNNSGNLWSDSHNSAQNYQNTHPEWLLRYDSYIILDPALPEVRQQIKQVVGDILSKYDVDGIVFDDYFYPYGGTTHQDASSIERYKPAGMDVHDWRRDNVNRMIAAVYDTIQSVRPSVAFGVSPFGIWTTDSSVAHKESISLPFGITGGNMYEEIYCDPVTWLKQKTVDYISPQLYWKITGNQDYGKLCPWWIDLSNQFGAQFYSSMAIYRYTENNSNNAGYYQNITEFANQALINRTAAAVRNEAPGHVFYNTRAWVYNKPFRNHFKTNVFQHPALTPAIGRKPARNQGMVTFHQPPITNSTLSWIYHETNDSVRYAIYAVPRARINDPSVFSQSEHLLGISYTERYPLPNGISTASHQLAVSVLDRYGNEFAPRVLGRTLAEKEAAQLTYPDNDATLPLPVLFRWNAVEKADCYIWQLATDANFTNIVRSQETVDTQFDTRSQLNIKDNGHTYYWRVRTRKSDAGDALSAVRTITLSPDNRANIDATLPSTEALKAYLTDDYLIVETPVAGQALVYAYNLSEQLVSTLKYNLQAGRNLLPLNPAETDISFLRIRMDTEIVIEFPKNQK
jgi:uncharacterized lipoprotein YddW (UPF0748 family)